MICKACNKQTNPTENEDCFERALNVLKQHYAYFKNALEQRDIELQQLKERNEQLNKALQLLHKNQQPAKRFKSKHSDDSWLEHSSSLDDRVTSDLSITDDDALGASNLNMALNSEQLFDTSTLSQTKNDVSLISSSEMVQNLRYKVSPKRNKQRDNLLKDRNNKSLERSKSEWHIKGRNSPAEKYWAMKFLQPAKSEASEGKVGSEDKKTTDKRLCLSLKKPNPSKMKQSLIHFNKSKDGCFRESDIGEDIIDASPVIASKNLKAGRSWTHRSGHNHSSNNNSTNVSTNVTTKKGDAATNKTLDDIVFDFSPSKKSNSTTLHIDSPKNTHPKKLKFDNDISTDCTSLPNEHLGLSAHKSGSMSVVMLTPGTQDIIFVDDTCNDEPEIDTMELLADIMKQGSTDNLETLKKYESKCIQKQQTKELDVFKKPQNKTQTSSDTKPLHKIKQEKNIQDFKEETNCPTKEQQPSGSTSSSSIKTTKLQNPLFSSDEQDTEDEDFMPKPFVLKQEFPESKTNKKLSIKQRFNIDCEDCEKLINFLDKGLTDVQIQQHLDKCKRHNNPDNIMRQNTPKDFWNPFILSFQTNDPRNEVLIDKRFKNSKK